MKPVVRLTYIWKYIKQIFVYISELNKTNTVKKFGVRFFLKKLHFLSSKEAFVKYLYIVTNELYLIIIFEINAVFSTSYFRRILKNSH